MARTSHAQSISSHIYHNIHTLAFLFSLGTGLGWIPTRSTFTRAFTYFRSSLFGGMPPLRSGRPLPRVCLRRVVGRLPPLPSIIKKWLSGILLRGRIPHCPTLLVWRRLCWPQYAASPLVPVGGSPLRRFYPDIKIQNLYHHLHYMKYKNLYRLQ